MQRVKRTEFGGSQELGKMQAENAAEREKSKKGRQNPTPPARSKASRLGIAKKFINFLLDQDASSLRSSTHANHWKDTV